VREDYKFITSPSFQTTEEEVEWEDEHYDDRTKSILEALDPSTTLAFQVCTPG
jgi:hypothetical protein